VPVLIAVIIRRDALHIGSRSRRLDVTGVTASLGIFGAICANSAVLIGI
jgi:hypothetical protein